MNDSSHLEPRIILASSSPRRRSLLKEAGYEFQVCSPADGVEDLPRPREAAADYVERSARQKAQDVAQRQTDGIIVGCDTVAVCEGQILGKPRDRAHAREILSTISGREHEVLTGICLWTKPGDRTLVEVDETLLRMDPLSAKMLDEYLDSGDWQGKAGAFGFQDGLDWVHILRGSVSNVVGLPLERFERMLRDMATR